MAYKTAELIEQSLEAIKEHKLFFLADIIAYLPCNKATFYNHKLDQLDSIRELLIKNRTETKVLLRDKWLKGNNATLQMGLYKLICEEDELKRLAMEYKEHSQDKPFKVEWNSVPAKDGRIDKGD